MNDPKRMHDAILAEHLRLAAVTEAFSGKVTELLCEAASRIESIPALLAEAEKRGRDAVRLSD